VGKFLAGIFLDCKDFCFSLVRPFIDFAADIIDAHKLLRHKQIVRHVERSVLSAYRPSIPTPRPKPLAMPAVIVSIPLVAFGIYKMCRKCTNSFCVSFFCITTIIGKQVRKDSALLRNGIASALEAFRKKLPDKLALPTLHMPSFNAKKYFAHFVIVPRIRMPSFSFRMQLPRLRIPRITLPSINLSGIRLPQFPKVGIVLPKYTIPKVTFRPVRFPRISFPQWHMPRLALPHISLPHFRTSPFALQRPSLPQWLFRLKDGYSNFLIKELRNNCTLPIHPADRDPKKGSFFRKYYVTEVVVLAIVFGTIGVFMSIYADTASNRANMPIVYQGRLMDASYVPKSDNTYYLAFEMYTTSDGSTCKWRTETTQDGSCAGSDLTALTATTSRGLFTVMLGAGAANNPTFGFNFDATASYLQVYVCPSATPGTVAGAPCETLTPRKQLGGVTYAYNADLLDGLNYDGFLQLSPTTNAQTLTFTGTTTNTLSITASSITSGSALILTGPSSSTGITGSFISSTSYVGASGKLVNLVPTFASSSGGSSYGIYLNPINANSSSANTIYGIYATSTDAVALGNTNYGIYNAVDNTGALTSGTKTIYGAYTSASGTLAGSGGSTTVYGNYITASAVHPNDAGTALNYGLYITNGSSNTNGTSTKYGIYTEAQTNADTNYGIYTAVSAGSNQTAYGIYVDAGTGIGTEYAGIFTNGNVGIGTTGPDRLLDILSSSNPQLRLTQSDGSIYTDFQMDSNGDFIMNVDGITNQLVLDNGGVVILGATTPYGSYGQTLEINKASADVEGGLVFNTWIGTSTKATVLEFNKSRGTSAGSYTIVGNDDALGNIVFRGADGGSAFRSAAGIAANVDGTTISSTSMPGRLIFFTTSSGSVTLSERMRIDSKGHIEYSQSTVPTLSSCGSSPGTVSGTDMAGRFAVGTGSPASCTLTFNQTWTNAPSCWGNNETSTMAVRATSSTSTIMFYASFGDSNTITYGCVGYR